MKIGRTVLLVSMLLFLACNAGNTGLQRKGEQSGMKKPQLTRQDMIAPGTCRVIAVVKQIRSDYRGTGQDDPCSRVPCRALIEIETVTGCGAGITQSLPLHQPLLAHFLPTLNPKVAFRGTKYPDVAPLYVGRRFEAIVEVPAEPAADSVPVIVQKYTVLQSSGK